MILLCHPRSFTFLTSHCVLLRLKIVLIRMLNDFYVKVYKVAEYLVRISQNFLFRERCNFPSDRSEVANESIPSLGCVVRLRGIPKVAFA